MVSARQQDLARQRRTLDVQIAECQADSEGIEEKIARLNAAKRQVAPIGEAVLALWWQISWQADDVDGWAGRTRSDMGDFVSEDASHAVRTYADEASDLYEHICDEITRLENERHDNEGALGWLAQRLNDVQNALDKCVN